MSEEEERPSFVTGGYGRHKRQWVNKKPKIQIFQNFWRFWPQFRQISPVYHKRTHLLENWVAWLTHWLLELFAESAFFGHFGWFLGWISAKLPLIRSKMRLHHNSLPFLPPASHFSALCLGHAQKSKFCDSLWRVKWPTSLGFSIFGFFFCLSFFSFSLFFAAVINLLLVLLMVKKLLRKCHRDGQFLAWSSQVKWH